MFRRTFLSVLTTIPFLSFIDKKNKKQHNLLKMGKAVKLEKYVEDLYPHNVFYTSYSQRYISFPILMYVTITYEYGSVTYQCFNVKLNDFVDLTLDTWLSCNTEEKGQFTDSNFGYSVFYKDYEFKLNSITMENYAS